MPAPWGSAFRTAWEIATEPARTVAAAVATGAKEAAEATARVAQILAREAKVIAQTTAEAVRTAASFVVDSAITAARKSKEAAEWALRQTQRAAKWTARKAWEGVNALAKGVREAYRAVKRVFRAVAAGVATALCVFENWAVAGLGMGISAVLSKPVILDVLRPFLGLGGSDEQKQYDGLVLGGGCEPGNASGVMPENCKQPPGRLPKISYVNGINTTYQPGDGTSRLSSGICKTMQAIADNTCSEVTGVYNATEGMGADLDECIDNIAKTSQSPAIPPIRDQIVRAARYRQPFTLFAHSQGGLITQEAVLKAKQQLINEDDLTEEEAEERLRVVEIKSFGTAALGWPKGPHYERFTNTADPVPSVIVGAQSSFPAATFADSSVSDKHHVFTKAHINPIDSHSMDDVYVPMYERLKGAKSCACKAA